MSSIANAAPPKLDFLSPQKIESPVLNLLKNLPENLGRVEKNSPSPEGRSSFAPFVIHIQDAHANPDAQQKISEILKFIENKIPASIGVEGAKGPLHPEYFDVFPDFPKTGEAIVKDLHEKGEVSGAELFAWEMYQKKKAENIFGIETPELYRENLKAYTDLNSSRNEIEAALQKVRMDFATRQSQILNPALRDFLKERSRRRSGKFGMNDREGEGNLSAYLTYLQTQSKNNLQIDLTDPIEQLRFPNLIRVLRLQQIEKEIDFEKAAKEWVDILGRMRSHSKSDQDKALIEALDIYGRKTGILYQRKAGFADFSSGESTYPRRLLERLYRWGQNHKINFSDRKQFLASFAQLVFQAEIEIPKLFEEMDALEKSLVLKLAQTEEEKKFFRDSENFQLFEKLLGLELTRSDFEKILQRKSEISLLIPKSPSLKFYYEIAFHFYETARKRDAAMVDNALASASSPVLVLITGGFHAEGIDEILREKGIGYAVIAPRIAKTDRGELYQKVMSGANADLTSYFNVKNPFPTKQQAIFFKEEMENGIPILTKQKKNPAIIFQEIQQSVQVHPVLSKVLDVGIYGRDSELFLRFIPKSAQNPLTSQNTALASTPVSTGSDEYANLTLESATLATPSALKLNFDAALHLLLRSEPLQTTVKLGNGGITIKTGIIPSSFAKSRSETRISPKTFDVNVRKNIFGTDILIQIGNQNFLISLGSNNSSELVKFLESRELKVNAKEFPQIKLSRILFGNVNPEDEKIVKEILIFLFPRARFENLERAGSDLVFQIGLEKYRFNASDEKFQNLLADRQIKVIEGKNNFLDFVFEAATNLRNPDETRRMLQKAMSFSEPPSTPIVSKTPVNGFAKSGGDVLRGPHRPQELARQTVRSEVRRTTEEEISNFQIENMIEKLGIPRNNKILRPLRILDLGTDSGEFLNNIRRQLTALGYQVETVGIEREIRNPAEGVIQAEILPDGRLQGPGENAVFQPDSFDLIFMNAPTMQRTPEEAKAGKPLSFNRWIFAYLKYGKEKSFGIIRLNVGQEEIKILNEESRLSSDIFDFKQSVFVHTYDPISDSYPTPQFVEGRDPLSKVGPVIISKSNFDASFGAPAKIRSELREGPTSRLIETFRNELKKQSPKLDLPEDLQQTVRSVASGLGQIFSISEERMSLWVAFQILQMSGRLNSQTISESAIVKAVREALGPYASLLDSFEPPVDLVEDMSRESLNTNIDEAITAVLLTGNNLTLSVSGISPLEADQTKSAIRNRIQRNPEFQRLDIENHFNIVAAGEGSTAAGHLTPDQRKLVQRLAVKSHALVLLSSRRTPLEEMGYQRGVVRVFSGTIDEKTAIGLTAELLRKLTKALGYQIQNLPELAEQDLVQRVGLMFEILKKRIETAA